VPPFWTIIGSMISRRIRRSRAERNGWVATTNWRLADTSKTTTLVD